MGWLGLNSALKAAFKSLYIKYPWLRDPAKRKGYIAPIVGWLWSDVIRAQYQIEYLVRTNMATAFTTQGILAAQITAMAMTDTATSTVPGIASMLGVDATALQDRLDETFMARYDQGREVLAEDVDPETGQLKVLYRQPGGAGWVDTAFREWVTAVYQRPGKGTEAVWAVWEHQYVRKMAEAVGVETFDPATVAGMRDEVDIMDGLVQATGGIVDTEQRDRILAERMAEFYQGQVDRMMQAQKESNLDRAKAIMEEDLEAAAAAADSGADAGAAGVPSGADAGAAGDGSQPGGTTAAPGGTAAAPQGTAFRGTTTASGPSSSTASPASGAGSTLGSQVTDALLNPGEAASAEEDLKAAEELENASANIFGDSLAGQAAHFVAQQMATSHQHRKKQEADIQQYQAGFERMDHTVPLATRLQEMAMKKH